MKYYTKLLELLHKQLSERQYIIVLSILIGFIAGFAAVTLKTFVHYIRILVVYAYDFSVLPYLFLFLPLLGIILTVFYIQYFRKGKIGKGVGNILYIIAKKSSLVPKDMTYSHIITSALTVGFGGSAGLEAPIVVTGAAIGSTQGVLGQVTYKERTLLLACGASAGIAAAFNAPIAGLIFSMEVLITEVTIASFVPLIIASVCGTLCSKIILNEDILFHFKLQQPFDYHNIHFYILLGILCGIIAVYYTRLTHWTEKLFKPKQKKRQYLKAIIGGLLLAILIWLFPSLFGEGYDSIKKIADNNAIDLMDNSPLEIFKSNEWAVIIFIGLVMLIKPLATSITIFSGGNAGNFAPSLFVGAYCGFLFSVIINKVFNQYLPMNNFVMVGMAGIISGLFHAPLTAIFLIAELTGGYMLILPLMLVSALSFAIKRHFEPFTFETKKLAEKGQLLSTNKDINILATLKIEDLLEIDFQKVAPNCKLGEIVDLIATSKRSIFPVVDSNGKLRGIIYLENIRDIMFKPNYYDKINAKQMMRKAISVLKIEDDMASVMKKFDETGAWNLPVEERGKYIGFISKSSIFTHYRQQLINNEET